MRTMKRDIITSFLTLQDELKSLSQFIYENPESDFKEEKCCNYIVNLLKKHGFTIKEKFLDMNTSFYASFGKGHPKICYICKYSATEYGHIHGNNINCMMSIGAAIALSKTISQYDGSVIVLGCPGSNFNGAELTIAKQGFLEDMDVILLAHAFNENLQSGTSMSVIPIEVNFRSKEILEEGIINSSPLDGCLLTFNTLGMMIKNSNDKCTIDGVSINSSEKPYTIPSRACAKFFVRGAKLNSCKCINIGLKSFLCNLCSILNIDYSIGMFDLPCRELLSNKVLSDLFTNNLKQCGIIDINCCRDIPYGLSIGAVSHTTPCIYPSIDITNNDKIKYPSLEFYKLSNNDYAIKQGLKSAKALALTALDILETPNLLKEMTMELYRNTNPL